MMSQVILILIIRMGAKVTRRRKKVKIRRNQKKMRKKMVVPYSENIKIIKLVPQLTRKYETLVNQLFTFYFYFFE